MKLTKTKRLSRGPSMSTPRALCQPESERVIGTDSLSYSCTQPSSAGVYRPYHVPSLDTNIVTTGFCGRPVTPPVLSALSLSPSDLSITRALPYARHARSNSFNISATDSQLYNTTPLQTHTIRHASSAPPSLNTSPLLFQPSTYAAAPSNWFSDSHNFLASTLAEPAAEPMGGESDRQASIRAMGATSWENLLTALQQSELSFINQMPSLTGTTENERV